MRFTSRMSIGCVKLELAARPGLFARSSSARIWTSPMAHSNLASTLPLKTFALSQWTLPCFTNSFQFPFLCLMFECSSSKTTLLPCIVRLTGAIGNLTVAACYLIIGVVWLSSYLRTCIVPRNSILWLMPAPVSTLFWALNDLHLLSVRRWACSHCQARISEDPGYTVFLRR